MKKILYIGGLVLAILIPVLTLNAQANKIPENIVLSFKGGNAAELAKFFHSNVELIILKNEDVYSRTQAEQIIRKFFLEHKPISFKIIHEGGSENSRYAIGSLKTAEQSYRIYILMKKQEESPLIHQLRIEEEEDVE
jgi:hypothetical protein